MDSWKVQRLLMTFEMLKMSLNDFWPAIDILQDMNQKNVGTLRVSYLWSVLLQELLGVLLDTMFHHFRSRALDDTLN